MMPSSSQVLDHQFIFHIMYGLRQFYHRQNKGDERFGKKGNNCMSREEYREEDSSRVVVVSKSIGKRTTVVEQQQEDSLCIYKTVGLSSNHQDHTSQLETVYTGTD